MSRRMIKDLFKGKLLWVALPPIAKKNIIKTEAEDEQLVKAGEMSMKIAVGKRDD